MSKDPKRIILNLAKAEPHAVIPMPTGTPLPSYIPPLPAARTLYMWQYNGRIIISMIPQEQVKMANIDEMSDLLTIVPTQLFPDYGNPHRKMAWFRTMCADMHIQLVECDS